MKTKKLKFKPVKLNPTEEQIQKAKRRWDGVKYEMHQDAPDEADKIEQKFGFGNGDWNKVYDMLCDIGCDDVAEALKGET